MTEYEQALSKHLQEYLTKARRQKFAQVLAQRTRKITVVLVDLFQEHNASAVLRSCEAFGVQDVHLIESTYKFATKRDIAMGTDRWLTLHRYRGENALDDCFNSLEKKGYQTASTLLDEKSTPLRDVPLEDCTPLALFFGTEKEGLPSEVIDRTDFSIHIPMYGFVESFNVSVAAAISLQILTTKMRHADHDWNLSDSEKEELLFYWTRKTVPSCSAIESRFQEDWNVESAR